jgi:hypothetical protein
MFSASQFYDRSAMRRVESSTAQAVVTPYNMFHGVAGLLLNIIQGPGLYLVVVVFKTRCHRICA